MVSEIQSMKNGILNELCRTSECSNGAEDNCSFEFFAIINPNSCINHVLVISVDILLLFIFLCTFVYRVASNKLAASTASQKSPPLLVFSAVFNGLLAVAYLGIGIWKFVEKLNTGGIISPLDVWLVVIIQGFTWFLLSFTISLRKLHLSHIASAKLFSIFSFLIGAFLCISSLFEAIVEKVASVKMVLNILCAPGAILSIIGSFRRYNYAETNREFDDGAFYAPLQSEEADAAGDISSIDNVTPFARGGFLSTMSFWWLNPLV